jgi:hypothetical protein
LPLSALLHALPVPLLVGQLPGAPCQ